MTNCRQLVVLVIQGMKFFMEDYPKSPTETKDMNRVPYASVVDSIMYAMVYIRPDIAQPVRFLSRFIANPGWVHWIAVKRVFKYLRGTSQYYLCFHGNPTIVIWSLIRLGG